VSFRGRAVHVFAIAALHFADDPYLETGAILVMLCNHGLAGCMTVAEARGERRASTEHPRIDLHATDEGEIVLGELELCRAAEHDNAGVGRATPATVVSASLMSVTGARSEAAGGRPAGDDVEEDRAARQIVACTRPVLPAASNSG